MTAPARAIVVVGVAALEKDDPGGPGREDPALASAVELARALGATLHVVHAYELPAPVLAARAQPPPAFDSRDTYAAEIERQLIAQTEHFPDVEIHCHALEGSPATTLCDVAARLGANLLVVGSTRRGRLWRGILGTTAEGVVRAATVPVLVLHQPVTLPLRRILLTTDLSEESVALLKRGLPAAQALAAPEFELRLLLVVSFDSLAPPPVPEAMLLQESEEALQRVASELPRPVKTRIRAGEPCWEIVHEAEEWKTDLLVLGTHGRSGFRRLWLGGTAAATLRGATCNVLVVPSAASEAEAGQSVAQFAEAGNEAALV